MVVADSESPYSDTEGNCPQYYDEITKFPGSQEKTSFSDRVFDWLVAHRLIKVVVEDEG